MARKESKGFVQLEWVCPNCSVRNPGSVKTCESCGAPQPENVKFERAAEEKIVTDEKLVQAAKAGADIHCGFCGTRNPGNAVTCSQCGADLKEGKAREAGQILQAAPTAPKVVTCSNCNAENPGTAKTCVQCGAPLPKIFSICSGTNCASRQTSANCRRTAKEKNELVPVRRDRGISDDLLRGSHNDVRTAFQICARDSGGRVLANLCACAGSAGGQSLQRAWKRSIRRIQRLLL